MNQLTRYVQTLDKELNKVNPSFQNVIAAYLELCEYLSNIETDESTWSINEDNGYSLDALIVGGYWFFTDYHGGQDSKEYECFSALGEIFKPGMSSLEDDTSEKDVYDMLVSVYEKE